MANYNSISAQFNQVQSPLNIDLIGNVLQAKQGKFDANLAQIDQTLAELKLQEDILIRPEDKERFATNIQSLLDEVNKSGKLDLSSGSLTRRIKNYVTTALDDYTVKQIGNSQNIRNFQTQVAQIKEKTPNLYNDANYAYSADKAGLQSYLNKETDDIGNLNYIPYKDLTEEHLKKLKTITDIKGKRYIEEVVNESGIPDPNGKYIRKKEIDGLTETEIQKYFGNLLTSEELTQMTINGWAKYGQPQTKDEAFKIYKEYNNKQIEKKSQDLSVWQAKANNSNLGDEDQRQAKIEAENLKGEIDNLKSIDYTKLDTDTVSLELEKAGYLNGLTQMASAEWSQSLSENKVYYADQDLDIARQKLEIEKEKLQIEKTKLAKEFSVDINGNPLVDGIVAKSSKEGELAEEMSQAGTGIGGLNTDYTNASNTIDQTAREFLTIATEKDKESFIKELNRRGVNSELKFDDPEKAKKYSLVNTIYEAFKDGGFDTTYAEQGKKMTVAYNTKKQRANDIVTVEKEGYIDVFNKNPDKYLTKIVEETMLNTGEIGDVSSLKKPINQVEQLYKKATGKDLNIKTDILGQAYPVGKSWYSVKQELKNAIVKNPTLVRDLANIKSANGKFYLKEDGLGNVENAIQRKTSEGAMMSSYNEFTFVDDKVKERLIKTIPEGRVTLNNTPTNERIDEKQPISFYRAGDNIIIAQTQKLGTGKDASRQMLKVILDPKDAAYQEILQYVNFTKSENTLKATATTVLPPVKVRIASHTTDETVKDKKVASIMANTPPELKKAFVLPPEYFATKETSVKSIEYLLTQVGVEKQTIDNFSNKLMGKINTYKLQPESDLDRFNTNYEFNIKAVKQDGTLLFKSSLGTNKMSEELNYLINSHPHIFIINQMLYKATSNPKEIGNLINNL